MLNLDRLRDSSLLMGGFEEIVRFWLKEPVEPAPELKSSPRRFHIEGKLPECLREYWEIVAAYRQLPLAGHPDHHAPKLMPKSTPFQLQGNEAVEMSKLDYLENPEAAYIRYAKRGTCNCCHFGIRWREEPQEWEICQTEDNKFKRFLDTSMQEFLIDLGLWNLSWFWVHEDQADKEVFQSLHDNAQTVWTSSDTNFWYHPDGIFGRSRSFSFMGSNMISLAFRTKKEAGEYLGRPVD